MIPARSQSALAEGFGKTASVMAALRRRRAIHACEFQLAHQSVNACVMSPRSFGGAAGHVGDVVVRRQDTDRTHVQVIESFVGNVRVAQVLDSRYLLPSSFGEAFALQTPESSPVS